MEVTVYTKQKHSKCPENKRKLSNVQAIGG